MQNQVGHALNYLKDTLPTLSDAKVRKGIFLGPHIRQLMKDPGFDQVQEGKEKKAWVAFKGVILGFLGNKRGDNFIQLVTVLLQKDTINSDATCTLKSMFSTPAYTFPLLSSCGAFSDECGEDFIRKLL